MARVSLPLDFCSGLEGQGSRRLEFYQATKRSEHTIDMCEMNKSQNNKKYIYIITCFNQVPMDSR